MGGVNLHLLLEANIRNLKDKTANTDPTRVEKSHNVQSKYLGISKFGILNFQTTSETHEGAKWYQTIEIPNIMQLADILDDPTDHITAGDVQALLSSNDVKVMCFPKGNKVLMSDNSEKDISDIQEGDIVKTFTGDNQMVVKTFKRDIDESGVQINLGDSLLVCTKNHPVYVISNYNDYLNGADPIIDCVPAGELTEDMAVFEIDI